MADDQAVKDLAEAIWKLAKAVERLAGEADDGQAKQWAAQAKRAGNYHR